MKMHHLILSTLVIVVGFCNLPLQAAQPIRVMSFNLRYGNANDGVNRWQNRKELVADTVKKFDPDLLGTQETLQFQADYLKENVDGYTYFGRSRMNTPNEHCGILYRTERFTWLAGGHFWLSESPSVPESKSWDSSLPRMATWVLLKDKLNATGHPVLFVNTHFDHRGRQARLESAKLISGYIGKLRALSENAHVVLTGDFNTPEGSPPYKAFFEQSDGLVDTFADKHPDAKQGVGTFNGFRGRTEGGRIDWIICSNDLTINEAEIDRNHEGDRYPSDHFPVTAVVEPAE